MFFSYFTRNRFFGQFTRVGRVLTVDSFDNARGLLYRNTRRKLYRFGRVIMVHVHRMRFRRYRLEVVTGEGAFVARIAISFRCPFGATCGRAFRVRLQHSARMRVWVRDIVVNGGQTDEYPA